METKLKVKEWGLEIEGASLFHADEIEEFGRSADLKVWRKFEEHNWSNYLSLEWEDWVSEEFKEYVITSIRKILSS
jgi:hypothetical protein